MYKFFAFLAVVTFSLANPISIFSTGINDDGSLTPAYSNDLHWTVQAPGGSVQPAVVVNHQTASDVSWTLPSGFQWISTQGDQDFAATWNMPVGDFIYNTTFDLTGLDPSTASLTGSFLVDNTVPLVTLNGNPQSITGGTYYQSPLPFSISSGFVSGVNTLVWTANNGGGPAGLAVQIQGSANPILTADSICNNANTLDWTPYGQGYYCLNSQSFVQCWGSDPVQSAVQNCAAGTSCVCSPGLTECSQHGTVSPCQ